MKTRPCNGHTARGGSICHLPPDLREDLDGLCEMVNQFKHGQLTADQFRWYHVPQGIYEQRRSGTYMARIRLPAGQVLPGQLRCLADVADAFGNGTLHVTTRQDIQVHDVSLDDLHSVLLTLARSGLSAKGGGGDTVRNITTCFDAGVCANEAFDVTPYATSLTEFLLADSASYTLPRKYKISLSGCGKDCAGATVSDVGLVAKTCNGTTGFAVHVGGGLGARSRVADVFEPFVPACQVHHVVEAVKRVFSAHGDRSNRRRGRLRFLIERIGLEAFRRLYETERNRLQQENMSALEVRSPSRHKDEWSEPHQANHPSEPFETWRQRCTTRQKQRGFHLVHVPFVLGDMSSESARLLADIAEQYGEGVLRTTNRQNIVIRWVRDAALVNVYEKLAVHGLTEVTCPVVRDIVSCTGATTCRLGLCPSRDLARSIVKSLSRAGLDLADASNLTINISGCPNACGRHPIASVGLHGVLRRIGGQLTPHYVIKLGGLVGEGRTRLGQGDCVISAERVCSVIVELFRAFVDSEAFPDFDTFLKTTGEQLVRDLASTCPETPISP